MKYGEWQGQFLMFALFGSGNPSPERAPVSSETSRQGSTDCISPTLLDFWAPWLWPFKLLQHSRAFLARVYNSATFLPQTLWKAWGHSQVCIPVPPLTGPIFYLSFFSLSWDKILHETTSGEKQVTVAHSSRQKNHDQLLKAAPYRSGGECMLVNARLSNKAQDPPPRKWSLPQLTWLPTFINVSTMLPHSHVQVVLFIQVDTRY